MIDMFMGSVQLCARMFGRLTCAVALAGAALSPGTAVALEEKIPPIFLDSSNKETHIGGETNYRWSPAYPIVETPPSSVGARNPRIAVNDLQHFKAVFHTGDAANSNIPGVTQSEPSEIVITRSTDGGIRWAEPVVLSGTQPGTGREYRPDIATNGSGKWLVMWDRETIYGAGLTATSMYYTLFTDDGTTLTGAVELPKVPGVEQKNDRNVSVDTDGASTWFASYIAELDGTTQLITARSIDDGETWESFVDHDSYSVDPDSRPHVRTSRSTSRPEELNGRALLAFSADGTGGSIDAYVSVLDATGANIGIGGRVDTVNVSDDDDSEFRHDLQPRLDHNETSGIWSVVWGSRNFDTNESAVHVARSEDGYAFEPAQELVTTSPVNFTANRDIDPWIATDDSKQVWMTFWSSLAGVEGKRDIFFATSEDNAETWSYRGSIDNDLYTTGPIRFQNPVAAVSGFNRWVAMWRNRPDLPSGGLPTSVPWSSYSPYDPDNIPPTGEANDLFVTGTLLSQPPLYTDTPFEVQYTIINKSDQPTTNVGVRITNFEELDLIDYQAPGAVVVGDPTDLEEFNGAYAEIEPNGTRIITLTFETDTPGEHSTRGSASPEAGDPFPADNIDRFVYFTVEQKPQQTNLSVNKTAYPVPGVPGKYLGFTITVRNEDEQSAPNVVVRDLLPEALEFDYAATSQGNWIYVTSGTQHYVEAYLGTIRGGERATLAIGTTPKEGYDGATNVATVQFQGNDTKTEDNTHSIYVPFTGGGGGGGTTDLQLLKTANTASAAVGTSFTYSLLATNAGSETANNVFINDNLPAGVSLTGYSTTKGSVQVTGNSVLVQAGALAPGQTVRVFLSVLAESQGLTENTATASMSGTDPNPGNNQDSETVNITAPASDVDLAVTKVASPSPAAVGSELVYTITVQNNGTEAATNVLVTDSLPAELQYQSATPPPTNMNGSNLEFVVASIGPGASVPIEIRTIPISGGSITNSATATTTGGDTNPSNNTGTVAVIVEGGTGPITEADISVTGIGIPAPAAVNQLFQMSYSVTNNGPEGAANVQVTSNVPAEFEYLSSTGPGGAGAFAAGVVTIPVGFIAPGATATVHINLLANVVGQYTFSADAAGSIEDPNTLNNHIDVPVQVLSNRGYWHYFSVRQNGQWANITSSFAVRNTTDKVKRFEYVVVYLSNDPIWDPSDKPLKLMLFYNIRPGQVVGQRFSKWYKPRPSGKYYIAVINAKTANPEAFPIRIP